ncbi:VCBS repeat protein [Dyadobacter jejuensis]|uniref:VCBS repeat protein n=1 Tax=Dyadobacter jejuensis TaxID=1082580 RepID=A0A316BD57_9BACT|nr:VCBS repeat-containing protein [Dyadobacter jejuensis]PWJ60417.1 VCBS repeat protein [Dyadobacter jejuensis]
MKLYSQVKWSGLLFLMAVLNPSCKQKDSTANFELLEASKTGVYFENTVANQVDFNIFTYRNFYNGGGVATGDVNNDGLADIFLTANMGPNRLFLNKGGLEFEDISEKAGISGVKGKWSTGVVMVDINHDDLLDIYVCNAGFQKGIGQENELFINNGDSTFTEAAAAYGLNDSGYTTHAAFFDYDQDGDLDVYILNNSFIPVNTLNYSNNRTLRAKDWPVSDFLKGGGDRLLRNDNGHFVDVSEQAGIYGSLIGFGLGVTVGDVNEDHLPDIYISNDFFERDYLYINKGDGTFSEELEKRIKHTSLASMGADMADINNDGYPEIFATDMLPRDEYRLRTTTSFENHYVFNLKKEKGFAAQYMQNSLQYNNQDGTFSELANFAGVAASDWSWGALMFDADNDGWTDILVCNGIYQDVIDQDFIEFFANDVVQKMALTGKKESMQEIVNKMPSTPIANMFFHNKGGLRFEEQGQEFGLEQKTFSNGAAYADLDNDGDLDLVINNVNQPVSIYKNRSEVMAHPGNYIKVKLQGEGLNTRAIGASLKVYAGKQIFTRQLFPSKGFQSSTEYPLTIGLGAIARIDSLLVDWPDGRVTKLENPAINQLLTLSVQQAIQQNIEPASHEPFYYFEPLKSDLKAHQENKYEDYYDERNLPMLLSREGPKAAMGDVNQDGLVDMYVCGALGQAGQLYLQGKGGFQISPQKLFDDMAGFEDTAALFFDCDQDGDLDLIVGSGGNQIPLGSAELPSRLYINNGAGQFQLKNGALPPNGMNTSVFCSMDFDSDGDLDLFVGSRSVPKIYGASPTSSILRNDGSGQFTDVTKQVFPALHALGMIRDAVLHDIDGDGKQELAIVGDWMSLRLFKVVGSQFVELKSGLEDYRGFWGSVKAVDLDEDGDMDLVLGNIGDNFSLKATAESPLKLYLNDFNKNGVMDKVITKTLDQKEWPILLKRELTTQFPFLKKKSLKHAEFAVRSIEELFPKDLLNSAHQKSVNYLLSALAINDGKGGFRLMPLPDLVQTSCITAIEAVDVNEDGQQDLVLAGNYSHFIPQLGALDACNGFVLVNEGDLKFTVLNAKKSGLNLPGEVKQLIAFDLAHQPHLIGLVNNEQPSVYKIRKP